MTGRSYEKELVDRDNIPFKDIVGMLVELNVINTALGGHKTTMRGVSMLLKNKLTKEPVNIAEIGCGGGDNLLAISRSLEKSKQDYRLIGVDIKQECLDYAAQHAPHNTTWICGDYRNTVWPINKPDIIFSSLFCHHFTDEQLVSQLKWLKENSRTGFFINDLHRHPLAYYSIKLLTKIFSKSYLVKNDGPLSVKRGFKKSEWKDLLSKAGITKYSIKWRWAFRHLICVPNE